MAIEDHASKLLLNISKNKLSKRIKTFVWEQDLSHNLTSVILTDIVIIIIAIISIINSWINFCKPSHKVRCS